MPVLAFDLHKSRELDLRAEAYRVELPEPLRAIPGSNLLDVLDEMGFNQERFLVNAASADDIGAISTLLARGVNVNGRPDEVTALCLAASHGHLRVVNTLLAQDANPNLSSYEWGSTPLTGASTRGHLDVVKVLLSYGADPNLCVKSGNTPLMLAAYKGHRVIVEELLAHCADITRTNDQGASAFSWASERGHQDIAQLVQPRRPGSLP